MSIWTTKSLSRDNEYIVMQHSLRGVNYYMGGIRFRDSYAVVAKKSKAYHVLKKVPMLKNAKEYPLTHLKNLRFITRTSDIKMVYGQDVYRKYLEALQEQAQEVNLQEIKVKEEELEKRTEEGNRCEFVLESGEACKHEPEVLSPSNYCRMHLLDDSKLEDYGIKIPKFLSKDERKSFRKYVLKKLESPKITEEIMDGEDYEESEKAEES